MAAKGYSEYSDSDESYTYSDDDAYDYDDFVVSAQKKSQARRVVTAKGAVPSKSKTTAGSNNQNSQGKATGPNVRGGNSNVAPGNTSMTNRFSQGGTSGPKPHHATSDNGRAATVQRPLTGIGAVPALNVVVCGRVDVGKSTLLGHLLTLLGAVDSRLLREGDMSWILDQGEDERSRGITIDPTKASAVVDVEIPTDVDTTAGSPNPNRSEHNGKTTSTHKNTIRVKIDFIDTPGHHDLISNLVRGAVFATAAVVVVDILDFLKEDTNGYFEQHMFLLWSLGVRDFIVCVNKVDRCEGHGSFSDAEQRVKDLTALYMSSASVVVVPTSGLKGLNLVKRDPSWGKGPSLIEALRNVALKTAIESKDTGDIKGNGSLHASGTHPKWSPPEGTILCHIFDMWENSKTQVGCSCFLETTLRTPCKLVSLPSGNPVTCTEVSCLLPATGQTSEVTPAGSGNTETSDLCTRIGQMKLTKTTWAYPHDFVDNMMLRDQEIQALTGDRLLVDKGTFDKLHTAPTFLTATKCIVCQVFVSPLSRHRLTLGFDVELFVGCFHEASAITSLWERISAGKWKRITSLAPGKEGVLTLQLTAPLFVQPVSVAATESVAPQPVSQNVNIGATKPVEHLQRSRLPLLSRVLLKVGADVVAGGAIVVDTPQ
ncbi:elongation factor Tu GTP binding domain [Babesia ovis]|uniref:Elongation factor Tu GTP binding domain n=1 Tax=Babesia ovis TaxID=5869 RepID=A0A9W5WUK4_BABOV|nr:elongation factor Tu GTP binding domain [Babesia ovis]